MSFLVSAGNPQIQDSLLRIIQRKDKPKKISEGVRTAEENNANVVELDTRNLDKNSYARFVQECKREQANAWTQTEFGDFVNRHLESLKREFESERKELEKEILDQRRRLEEDIRQEYEQVLKIKNSLIKELTKENDHILEELKTLRKSSRSELCHGTTKSELISGKVSAFGAARDLVESHPGITMLTSYSRDEAPDGNEVSSRKETSLDVETVEIIGQEKSNFNNLEEVTKKTQEEIRKESEMKNERESLLATIAVLKDGLKEMKTQKLELVKIFEGERNAIELKFLRKEQKLKAKMKIDLQRKVIRAHREWSTTKL